jgi:acyl carrier protein phosphodiesterase
VNYLAHAYLSFDQPEILAGNLISDFVKGKKKLDYPPGIQKGITLHRSIDWFTDTHEATRQAKSFFRPVYGLYSGPITDVIYDHFLATDPEIFPPSAPTNTAPAAAGFLPFVFDATGEPPSSLAAFSQRTYSQLAGFISFFPDRFSRMFSYMRSQDWLTNYWHRQGIFNSLTGLSRRASHMPDPATACSLFIQHYEELQACYRAFFPAVRSYAAETLQKIE